MTEDSKNKPTDIEQSIERIEALLSTALEELSYARKTAPGDMQAEAKTANWKDLRSKLDAARYRFLKLHKLNYEWQYSDDPAQRVSEYKIVVPVDLDHPDNADGSMSFDDAVDVLMEKDQLEKLSCARKTAPEDTVEILRAQNRELYAENDRLRQDIEKSRRSPQLCVVTDKWGRTWTPEALLGELGKRTESLDETLRENAELRKEVKQLTKYYELKANAYLAQVDEAAAEIRSLRAKENDLKAQNRELYEENDKLRQEIGFLRIKEKQAIDTQMYQSVWMQNDELQLKIRDLKAELATERAYRDSALALAKAIIRDVEGKI